MSRPAPAPPGFTRILCAVDFSAGSRAALRCAAAIAHATRGSLTLLYVSDPLLLAAAAAGYDRARLERQAERELAQFVHTAVAARLLASVALRTETRVGKPVAEIAARARAGRHDLIVMGTRGLNGARKLLLGSTTSGVLRRTRVPVLAIPDSLARRRGARLWPPRRVAGAIDLGRHARADASALAAAAARFGVPLTLVHVVPAAQAPAWYRLSATRPARSTGSAERRLDDLRRRHPDVVDQVQVLSGDPVDGVIAAAEACAPCLVAMVLRGARSLFGPGSEAALYEVLCRGVAPALALPPEAPRRRTPR